MNNNLNIYNIKDFYILRQHAFEQGYSIKEYIKASKEQGFELEDLIKAAYEYHSLAELIKERKKIIKRRKIAVKGFVIASIVYLIHAIGMFGYAEYSIPQEFRNRQKTISYITTEIKNVERKDSKENNTKIFQLSGLYFARQELISQQEPVKENFDRIVQKAFNPLCYFFSKP